MECFLYTDSIFGLKHLEGFSEAGQALQREVEQRLLPGPLLQRLGACYFFVQAQLGEHVCQPGALRLHEGSCLCQGPALSQHRLAGRGHSRGSLLALQCIADAGWWVWHGDLSAWGQSMCKGGVWVCGAGCAQAA